MDSTQRARRVFLEKAGKFAAYTPPLMLGLLMPGEHAIASGMYRNQGRNQGEDQNDQGEDEQ
jgi:hypothetical protein